MRADGPPASRHPAPLWARICLILGSAIMVVSGGLVVVPRVLEAWVIGGVERPPLVPPELLRDTIDGAINVLLLGMDERKGSDEPVRADTIIILHIPANHDQAYLISLPRDLEVDIPAFAPTNFRGDRTKINAAFAYGARDAANKPDTSARGRTLGANLTMRTINQLVPGGLTFNGAAIINFAGFRKVLDALEGVHLCVDEETRSIHFDIHGHYHTNKIADINERKVYPVGCRDMQGWEALDFARQRYGVKDADYTRQRHQQQLLMAMFRKMTSRGTLTDPGKIVELQRSAGGLLTLDLGRASLTEWFYTLRGITADRIVMVKTNGGRLNPIGNGNEALTADSVELLKAVRDDTVLDFLADHRDWIATEKHG
ncbi:MAG TPA: LCP family protein [Micromonosporaceae bacterium]